MNEEELEELINTLSTVSSLACTPFRSLHKIISKDFGELSARENSKIVICAMILTITKNNDDAYTFYTKLGETLRKYIKHKEMMEEKC